MPTLPAWYYSTLPTGPPPCGLTSKTTPPSSAAWRSAHSSSRRAEHRRPCPSFRAKRASYPLDRSIQRESLFVFRPYADEPVPTLAPRRSPSFPFRSTFHFYSSLLSTL